jgi:hypothetical protein
MVSLLKKHLEQFIHFLHQYQINAMFLLHKLKTGILIPIAMRKIYSWGFTLLFIFFDLHWVGSSSQHAIFLPLSAGSTEQLVLIHCNLQETEHSICEDTCHITPFKYEACIKYMQTEIHANEAVTNIGFIRPIKTICTCLHLYSAFLTQETQPGQKTKLKKQKYTTRASSEQPF